MKSIFAIYKPKGMTSHDMVNRVRHATGVRRVGHGGTLDPLASGVLVIAVGREYTKQLDQYVKGEKEYIATIKLGFESTTDDEEGEKVRVQGTGYRGQHDQKLNAKPSTLYPSLGDIERASQKFVGIFPQMPPQYSAKKVGGKVAYKQARKGLSIKLEPKNVEIMDIKIVEYIYPILIIRVQCGSGVYIRSLARDIGRELGTGGYLADLERTKVGKFEKKDCITLDQLKSQGD